MLSGGFEREHRSGFRRRDQPAGDRAVGDSHRWLIPITLALVFWPALLGDYVGDDHRLIENNYALHEHDFVVRFMYDFSPHGEDPPLWQLYRSHCWDP